MIGAVGIVHSRIIVAGRHGISTGKLHQLLMEHVRKQA